MAAPLAALVLGTRIQPRGMKEAGGAPDLLQGTDSDVVCAAYGDPHIWQEEKAGWVDHVGQGEYQLLSLPDIKTEVHYFGCAVTDAYTPKDTAPSFTHGTFMGALGVKVDGVLFELIGNDLRVIDKNQQVLHIDVEWSNDYEMGPTTLHGVSGQVIAYQRQFTQLTSLYPAAYPDRNLWNDTQKLFRWTISTSEGFFIHSHASKDPARAVGGWVIDAHLEYPKTATGDQTGLCVADCNTKASGVDCGDSAACLPAIGKWGIDPMFTEHTMEEMSARCPFTQPDTACPPLPPTSEAACTYKNVSLSEAQGNCSAFSGMPDKSTFNNCVFDHCMGLTAASVTEFAEEYFRSPSSPPPSPPPSPPSSPAPPSPPPPSPPPSPPSPPPSPPSSPSPPSPPPPPPPPAPPSPPSPPPSPPAPPPPPAAPSTSIAIHGDPMVKVGGHHSSEAGGPHGGGQHFWMKDSELTPMLTWTAPGGGSLMLWGRTFNRERTGSQWFKQFIITQDGMNLINVTAKDTSFGTMQVQLDGESLEAQPPSSVDGPGKAAQGKAAYQSKRGDLKVETAKRNKFFIADKHADKLDVEAGGLALTMFTSAAAKFEVKAQQARWAHLNIDFRSGLPSDARGIIAEFAGIVPISPATQALLKPGAHIEAPKAPRGEEGPTAEAEENPKAAEKAHARRALKGAMELKAHHARSKAGKGKAVHSHKAVMLQP